MSLLIAMPGPRLPEFENVAAARAALPVLPVLSALLARARHLPGRAHWRAGVLAGCGAPAAATDLEQAAVAARAVAALAKDAAICMVAPLHVVAGISRVHLPPDGRLQLEAGELLRWTDAFNRELGGSQLQLHAVAGGWLLAAPFADGARDPAPEVLLGEPLARAAARDDAERALRRLGAEVEMWLAAHPLNREREARQLPPVNSLWFWGGARAVALPPLPLAPRLLCVAGEPDAWLAGLAAYCAAPLLRVAAWPDLPSRDSTLLVLPHLAGSLRHWAGLDAQWFEPAAQALRDGDVDTLRLQIGGSAWQLPDHSPLRFLRRRRPWHEQVCA
jgi:hypothetical protein